MNVVIWIRRIGEDAVSEPAMLTTDHAASSYGLPVVVTRDGEVLGPADLADELVIEDPIAAGHAEAAGYRVAETRGAQ
jgi:hypothetical protein